MEISYERKLLFKTRIGFADKNRISSVFLLIISESILQGDFYKKNI
jgi:hypothetical protein